MSLELTAGLYVKAIRLAPTHQSLRFCDVLSRITCPNPCFICQRQKMYHPQQVGSRSPTLQTQTQEHLAPTRQELFDKAMRHQQLPDSRFSAPPLGKTFDLMYNHFDSKLIWLIFYYSFFKSSRLKRKFG